MHWRAVSFLCVLACGRLRFADRDGGATETDGDSTTTDGTEMLGPFQPPTQISVPVTGPKYNPSMTSDQLDLYFVAMNGGSYDIYVATRTASDAPWGAARALTEICSTTVTDTDPEISPDGLTLYFSSLRTGTSQIYRSTRASRTASWGAATMVSELDTAGNNYAAAPDASGLRLVMASDRSSAAQHLFYATRADVGATWSAPVEVVNVNSFNKDDATPTLAGGGTNLMYSTARSDPNFDLWETKRATPDATFDQPLGIAELNTTSHEGGPWLSEDRHVLLFESDRGGQIELYQAVR